MTTKTGKTEIDGVSLEYRAENVQYGKRPSSMFAAMQATDERGYAIVMGDASDVLRFGLYVKDRGGTVLVGLLNRGGRSRSGEPFAACILGEWPTARLESVVSDFTPIANAGPGAWARQYMEKTRRDPDRADVGPPDEDDMRFFAKLYDEQCSLCAL